MEEEYFTKQFVECVKKPDAERSDQVRKATWTQLVCPCVRLCVRVDEAHVYVWYSSASCRECTCILCTGGMGACWSYTPVDICVTNKASSGCRQTRVGSAVYTMNHLLAYSVGALLGEYCSEHKHLLPQSTPQPDTIRPVWRKTSINIQRVCMLLG